MNMVMQNKKQNGVTLLIAVLLVIAGTLFVAPHQAVATEPGSYIVTTQPTYANPKTGVAEDLGTNSALGESMVMSVLGESALLEVGEDGTNYVTVRFALMDNIGEINVFYQVEGQDDFTAVPFTITQENAEDHEADLNFQVPDETALIRFDFFVTPMGRNVVFFTTLTDPVAGEGDFVVGANQSAQKDTVSTPEQASTDETAVVVSETPVVEQTEESPVPYVVAGVALVVVIALVGYLVYRSQMKKKA